MQTAKRTHVSPQDLAYLRELATAGGALAERLFGRVHIRSINGEDQTPIAQCVSILDSAVKELQQWNNHLDGKLYFYYEPNLELAIREALRVASYLILYSKYIYTRNMSDDPFGAWVGGYEAIATYGRRVEAVLPHVEALHRKFKD